MFASPKSRFNEIAYSCMSIYVGAVGIAGFTGNLPKVESHPYDPAIAFFLSATGLVGAVDSRAQRRSLTKAPPRPSV